MDAKPTITIKRLKDFSPLNKLSEKQFIVLIDKIEEKHYQKGTCILEIDSKDNLEYFLNAGTVRLESFDGRVKEIAANSDSAKTAIALLQPRKYKVIAVTDCDFLVVSQHVVNSLLDELPKNKQIEFSTADAHSGHEIEDIEESFLNDLKTNNIVLPSFPDVALKIKGLLDDDDVTAGDIADVLANDPAIVVKLIKTCNSVIYRTATEITSCQDAIVRLGFETTRRLVNVFAMKELFSSKNTALREKMRELWSDSREVATISYVLASITPRMNPELAMLAGLVQNIGIIPVIEHLDHYPQFMKVESKAEEAVTKLKNTIGPRLLENWGFQEELVKVAANSENWFYESPGDKADYVDIAIVAQVHALLEKHKLKGLPNFSEIPAFRKLGENGLTPEQSQKVLHESHRKIAELKALLAPDTIPTLS